MYSPEFMAYLASYQREEAKPKEEEKPCFFVILLKSLFGIA